MRSTRSSAGASPPQDVRHCPTYIYQAAAGQYLKLSAGVLSAPPKVQFPDIVELIQPFSCADAQ